MQKLFKVEEIGDLYADSYLTDNDGNLIFISLWGRDITMNEAFARITLNDAEINLTALTLIDPDTDKEIYVHIRNKETLQKHTGRVNTNVFGEMVQGFLYEKMAVKPDIQSGKALILYLDEKPEIWELVKQVCHLPLVDHWKESLLDKFNQNNWIRQLTGTGVNAIQINFDHNALEEVISHEVKQGNLTAVEGVAAPEPVKDEVPDSSNDAQYVPATWVDAKEALKSLRGFMSEAQITAIKNGFRSEENQFFYDKAVELANIINTMPKTYEQSEKGDEAIAYLHYFHGSMDWYISEKDMMEEQHQAYGLADMGYPEYGYISITELIENGVQLDFYFKQGQTLRHLKMIQDAQHQPDIETA